jgi:hypothetical protein
MAISYSSHGLTEDQIKDAIKMAFAELPNPFDVKTMVETRYIPSEDAVAFQVRRGELSVVKEISSYQLHNEKPEIARYIADSLTSAVSREEEKRWAEHVKDIMNHTVDRSMWEGTFATVEPTTTSTLTAIRLADEKRRLARIIEYDSYGQKMFRPLDGVITADPPPKKPALEDWGTW